MYKERIRTIHDVIRNHKKTPTISFDGKWLDDLGYSIGKRVLIKTINEDDAFSFEISLLD